MIIHSVRKPYQLGDVDFRTYPERSLEPESRGSQLPKIIDAKRTSVPQVEAWISIFNLSFL